MTDTRRRDVLVGATVLLLGPLAAVAAETRRVRRVAVLIGYAENDPEAQLRLIAFKEGLATLGWVEDRNVRFDVRWSGGDPNRASVHAKELVALRPDVILSNTTPATAAVQRETQTVPIVFTVVADPIGSGFIKSLSRPGGNITGLLYYESTVAEKWLELLKQIAPQMMRVAVMFNPKTASYVEYYLQPLRTAATRLGVKMFTAPVDSDADIERTIGALGSEVGSGLITMVDSFLLVHRKPIIALAARYKVPAMYYTTPFVEDGGLIAYGVDAKDLFRRAARYVDRILRGTTPQDLPVEQPTKFEFAINLRTARAFGLTVPQSILLRADKVIE